MTWKLAAKGLLALAVGSGLAVLAHVTRPASSQQTPDRTDAAAADAMRRAGYEFGTSLADLPLTACSGRSVRVLEVAAKSGAVLHFVDRSCGRCVADLAQWSQVASVSRIPVLVIACNEAEPLKSLAGFNGDCENLYSLLRPELGRGPRAVPITVVVNRDGVITGLVPSVKRLLAAS